MSECCLSIVFLLVLSQHDSVAKVNYYGVSRFSRTGMKKSHSKFKTFLEFEGILMLMRV